MSEQADGDRPVTAAELAAVTTALDELRQATEELRTASTERERQEARGDVREAREDLDELAGRLGISRAKLDESIAQAKKAERKEELRPIIAELLVEEAERAKAEADEAQAALDAEGKPKPKPKPKPAAASDDDGGGGDGRRNGANPDTGPVRPHWSEQHVGDLLR